MLITCPKCSARYEIPSEINLKSGKKVQCSACQCIFEFHPEEVKELEKTTLLPPEDAVLSINTKTERIVIKTQEPEQKSVSSLSVLPEAFRPVQEQKERAQPPYFWILLCAISLVGFIIMALLYKDLSQDQALYMSILPSAPRIERPVRLPKSKEKIPPVIEEQNDIIIPLQINEEVRVPNVGPTQTEKEPVVPKELAKLSVQAVRFRKTPTGNAVLIEGSLKNNTSETLPVPEKIYALAYNKKGSLLFEKEIYLPSGALYPDMEQPFFGTYTTAEEDIQWVDVVLEK